jgi:hypothetical protein
MTRFFSTARHLRGLLIWGALSGERTGLYFTIAAVFASVVILMSESRGAHDHLLLSDLKLPQPGGPGPFIYIPQEQGGPVIPPGTGL